MSFRLDFDPASLHSVAGGRSAIDIPRLNIHSLAEAESFIRSYGYDYSKDSDVERLWYFYRRAIVLMTERLGVNLDEIPEIFRERRKLQDLRYLLVYASSRDAGEVLYQRWSCALLRCLHVFVHAETDLFSFFSEEIQKQILGPLQNAVVSYGNEGKFFLKSFHKEGHIPVELSGFEVKPLKTSSSTVIKLLAKPDALAMKIFDKLGVRFITNSIFDSFQVIRFLVEENLISFPHIMPDQSSNNIYPVDLFLKICDELIVKAGEYAPEQLEALFHERFENETSQQQLFRKENTFSSSNYKFIKFIARKLITIDQDGHHFSFFYPYEIQILDLKTHQSVQSGPSEHVAYKERQRAAARERLFPEIPT